MRILYLCSDLGIPVLGRKGASAHVRGLAAALSHLGHSVILATPLLNRSPWEEPAHLDLPILHLPPGDLPQDASAKLAEHNESLGVSNPLPGEVRQILYNKVLADQLIRRFEKNPPDLIYERAALHGTVGVSLARELERPILVELNTPLTLEQSTYRGIGLSQLALEAERWTLTRADGVLTVSSALRDHVIALGAEPERVHVLPNGVDSALFHPRPSDPRIRARWGLGDGPVLGFCGGLRPWHGVEALPALLGRLIHRHPGLRLLVVGDGPLRKVMVRALEERGLAGRAVFTGAVPHEEVPGLLHLMNIAVAPYPPMEHPFYFSPLKLFEYMASGVAVVAAELGQVAEVVRDGETGLLYPAGDLDALAEACERLLADPERQQRLGRAAAEEVRGRYTWDHNAARVAELALSVNRQESGE